MVRRARTVIGVLAATITAVLALAAPASADAQDIGKIRNWNSEKCLAIAGNSTALGVQAIQFTCSSSESQTWDAQLLYYDSYNNPVYRLHKIGGNNCLAIAGANPDNARPAIQYTCSDSADQKWAWDSGWRLHNVATGKCLAVPGGSLSDAVGVIQWTCGTGNEQKWY